MFLLYLFVVLLRGEGELGGGGEEAHERVCDSCPGVLSGLFEPGLVDSLVSLVVSPACVTIDTNSVQSFVNARVLNLVWFGWVWLVDWLRACATATNYYSSNGMHAFMRSCQQAPSKPVSVKHV